MSWTTASVGSVAEVVLGRQRAPEYADGPHMTPYLRAANIKDGRVDLTSVFSMNFTPSEQSVFSLRPGDIFMTEGSGSLLSVGSSAVWRGEIEGPICFQNTLLRLRPRHGIADGRFLSWWARSALASGLFASIATGANIHHLSAERLRSLPLNLPSLGEQRRIAAFLDREIPRIAQLENATLRASVLLIERRRASLYGYVTGASAVERRRSGLTWAQSLPAQWSEGKVNFLARMGSGHTPSRSKPELWINSTVPWITTGEVSQVRDDRRQTIVATREMISHVGMASSSAELHPAGTVVLSRTASAGFSAVMGRAMATSQDFVTWTCGPRLDPYYLLWCLRAMRDDLLGRLAMGSTHKTIYVPDLQTLRIPLPSISEQRDIVAKIGTSNAEVDKLMDLIDRQQDLLAERRQGLITAAVTGQVSVTTARSVRET